MQRVEAKITRWGTVPRNSLTDSELLLIIQGGSDEAEEFLLEKYKYLVRAKACSYFLIGADREDLIQEGMIGLFKAIHDFRHDRNVSFRVFAELCITRQMITAIKTATRKKHTPLNTYVSFNKPMYNEEDGREHSLIDTICGTDVIDPADLVISDEDIRSMRFSFGEILSNFEAQVTRFYLDGKSYQEIAEMLDRQTKSVDNALQRVKRKIGLRSLRRGE